MNLLKSKLRRTTAVLAGSFLGVAGAVGISASPASAHHPTLSGDAVCTTAAGDWKVTWTIGNSETDITGTITKVEVLAPQGGTVSGVKVGDTLPVGGTNLTATQELSASNTEAKLLIEAQWVREYEGKAWHKDKGKDGGTVRKVHTRDIEVSVSKPSSEGCKKDEPEPNPSSPSPTPSETPDDESPAPEFAFESYCDGLLIKADTPAGVEALTLTVKSNQGETKELPITPGKSTEVFFDGVEGLSVEISYEGEVLPFGDINWEPSAEECDGEGGGLPVTGAAAGGIAGGAAVLLGVGGLLFFLARRRKVQFTA